MMKARKRGEGQYTLCSKGKQTPYFYYVQSQKPDHSLLQHCTAVIPAYANYTASALNTHYFMLFSCISQFGDRCSRDDQEMSRGLRVDVLKGNTL